jgi:hypothetical protein
VQADWDVLRLSRSVIVETKGDHKHYLVGHTEEPELQALAPARTSGSRHVAMQDSPLE